MRRVVTLHVTALAERIDILERERTERSAEHAAMVHRLDTLYRRIAARMTRQAKIDDEKRALELELSPEVDRTPSALDMRRKLRGH